MANLVPTVSLPQVHILSIILNSEDEKLDEVRADWQGFEARPVDLLLGMLGMLLAMPLRWYGAKYKIMECKMLIDMTVVPIKLRRKKFLALPYLSCDRVDYAFQWLVSSTKLTGDLVKLGVYIRGQWITFMTFSTTSWTVFKCTMVTNNDVAGRHNQFNRRAGKSQTTILCILLSLLRNEAADVAIIVKLVSDKKMQCIVKNLYIELCRPVYIHDGTGMPIVAFQLRNHFLNAFSLDTLIGILFLLIF